MALDDRRALPVARALLRRSRLAGLGVLAAAVVGLIASAPGRGEPPADHAAPPPGSSFDVVRLDRLLDTGRLFELRDAVRGIEPDASLDALFYRGIVASHFNRIDDAVRLLTRFLDRSGTASLTTHVREAHATLADLHRRTHRYGSLVDSRRRMLTTFRTKLTADEVAGQEDRLRLWEALRGVPPQTVEIAAGADLPLEGGLDIRVVFPTGDVMLNPDTGSGLSIITRSDAARLGLRLIEVPVGVTTVTGAQPATLAVAPEMRIGAVVVRNAVFLVFPDAALFRPRQGIQRHGTIGAPVLAALGNISFTRSGRFVVHASPPGVAGTEFFLSDYDPVVAARFAGRPLRLVVDTGASETTLWPLFEAECREVLPPGAQRVEREVGSVGRVRRLPMLEVPGMTIDLGDARLALPGRRLVLLESTTDDHRLFHGSLGQDIYRLRERLTISYTAMQVAIGPEG